jgi:hypothetical protein
MQRVIDSPRANVKMKLLAHTGMMRIYEAIENHEKSAIHQKEVLRLYLESYPVI